MKKLLIIGAGGHGRCCLDIARKSGLYEEINFIDDNGVGQVINGAKILGNTESLCEYVEEYQNVFVAMGNNALRKTLIEKARTLGYHVVSLISAESIISDYATIGEGSVVFPGVVVEANAEIQKGCIVTANATINHDAIIKECSLVNSNSVIRPNTVIGELTKIGCQCVITFGKELESGSEIPDGEII